MDNCGVDMDVWVSAHILIQCWLVWDIFNMGDAPETGILWCSFGEVVQVYKVIMLPSWFLKNSVERKWKHLFIYFGVQFFGSFGILNN